MQTDDNPLIARSNRAKRRPQNANSSRVAKAMDQKGKGQRGRPQKSNGMDSPADKRRAQIRAAQRAYRSRQEMELSTLRGRVKELEDVMYQTSQICLQFRNDVLTSGLLNDRPDLAAKLKETAEKCMSMARQGDVECVGESIQVNKTSKKLSPSQRSKKTSGDHQKITTKEVRPADDFNHESLEVTYSGQLLEWERSNDADTETSSDPTFSHLNDLRSLSSIPSTIELTEPISTVDICANNKSLADRLDMACALRAYRRLKDPSITTAELSRGFKFLMTVMSRDQIATYFKEFIDSLGASAVFDNWKVPEVILGGAGTHYPRKMQSKRYNLDPRLDGLPEKSRGMTQVSSRANLQSEFQEDWFNSGDVQGFLAEYGVMTENHSPALGATRNVSECSPQSKFPWGSLPPGTVLVVDESKLLRHLSTFCVCLGRSAGFRRKDVEKSVLQHVKLCWV
ncbi:hypothetical protein BGW36DRAFT_374048 [Talaromyces proteolyticus]|uniref:BZIP domain-containing protein n=1 Tax=Talaromyces proteolyticus TaxID=1131652 RepID=A0AAD4Q2J1_9EURO|nr:uncharacterized protein BGW36DRAFT_374048 [Talaromyces proteolyticus]KAH8700388.1 hypothetical protein BGW36DRAFT_374048 [Talaromyces proteolyticus]